MFLRPLHFLKSRAVLSIVSGIALTGVCEAADTNSSFELAASVCTRAVIDNYYLKPLASSSASSSLLDEHGNIFVSGSAYTPQGSCHWIVRKSVDGGVTWQTVDDYELQTGALCYNDITSVLGKDSNGNLFVAGFSFDTSGKTHWIVRKSTDNGTTWNTVENFRTTGSITIATGFTSDINGNVYTSGYGSTKASGYHWYVRKSTNGGLTWATVDDFQFTSGAVAEPSSITSDASGNIYCAGSASNRWVVRKSVDAGATWTTVDNFQGQGGVSGAASIIVDANNYIYTAGSAYTSVQGESLWLVRRSIDGGNTWESIDNFQLAAGRLSSAKGLSTDANGDIYVTGYGEDATGYHWITRKSTDQGTTWTTIDSYQLKAGKMAMGKTVSVDAEGNVFTGGSASNRWIVRKISCE